MEAENPFKQQYTGEEREGTSESSTAGSTESAGATSVPIDEPSAPSYSPPVDSDGEPSPDRLTYFSYAIDVRVTPGGSQEGGNANESTVRRNLPELTMLPSRDTPALVFMGSTKDGKKALMMVSSNVEAIFGDAKCVLGSETCQLLVMEPGIPETFVYGGEGRTYKIELLKIHLSQPTSSTAPRSASPRRASRRARASRASSSDGEDGQALARGDQRLHVAGIGSHDRGAVLQSAADDLRIDNVTRAASSQAHPDLLGAFLVERVDFGPVHESRHRCRPRSLAPRLGEHRRRHDDPCAQRQHVPEDRLDVLVTPLEGDQRSRVEYDISRKALSSSLRPHSSASFSIGPWVASESSSASLRACALASDLNAFSTATERLGAVPWK